MEGRQELQLGESGKVERVHGKPTKVYGIAYPGTKEKNTLGAIRLRDFDDGGGESDSE